MTEPDEELIQADEKLIQADGFDEAVIGVTDIGFDTRRIVYDAEEVIDILMTRDGMSWEDALEYYNFNIAGSYVGKATPLFIWRMTMREIGTLD
jgi:hypothetical protein